jgi:cytochrome c556
MAYDWKQLRKDVGKNVEDTGRMLRREKPFTKEDLTDLRDTLNLAAESIQTIRDATFK